MPIPEVQIFGGGAHAGRRVDIQDFMVVAPKARSFAEATQRPVFLRNGLAGMLGLSERRVRVIAPIVGGGFGPKIMLFYPEEMVIPWAAESSTARSNGSKTGLSISSPPRMSAAKPTTPRSRSTSTAASPASRTCSCTTPAPIILTA